MDSCFGEVVWDRSHSQLGPETTAPPFHRAGIDQSLRPMEHQRRTKPFSTDALVIEGQLFGAHVPMDLRGPIPKRREKRLVGGATAAKLGRSRSLPGV